MSCFGNARCPSLWNEEISHFSAMHDLLYYLLRLSNIALPRESHIHIYSLRVENKRRREKLKIIFVIKNEIY